jgi:hypothetical protein
MNQSAADN